MKVRGSKEANEAGESDEAAGFCRHFVVLRGRVLETGNARETCGR